MPRARYQDPVTVGMTFVRAGLSPLACRGRWIYLLTAHTGVSQAVRSKESAPMQETQVQSLGWEDSPEGEIGNPLQCF